MYKRVKAVFEIIPKARFKAMELLEAHDLMLFITAIDVGYFTVHPL